MTFKPYYYWIVVAWLFDVRSKLVHLAGTCALDESAWFETGVRASAVAPSEAARSSSLLVDKSATSFRLWSEEE